MSSVITHAMSRWLSRYPDGGFLVMIGTNGSGKSNLAQNLSQHLGKDQVEIITSGVVRDQVNDEYPDKAVPDKSKLVWERIYSLAAKKIREKPWVIIDSTNVVATRRQELVKYLLKLNPVVLGICFDLSEDLLKVRLAGTELSEKFRIVRMQMRHLEIKPDRSEGFVNVFFINDTHLKQN